MPGTSTVLVGLQYGDEGKGRILDKLLKSNPDDKVVARFNGGPNAGHTVKEGELELKLHQVPSGVLDQNAILYIATGCVINPEKLVAEIEEIERLGKQYDKDLSLNGRLFISSKVTLIQPHQRLLDGINGKTLGTTGNGIGNAYAGKALRKEGIFLRSLRLGEYLADSQNCGRNSEQNLLEVLERDQLSNRRAAFESLGRFDEAIGKLQPYISSDPLFLEKKVRAGLDIFFEGAQAFMLDVDHGTYPFVTSSSTGAGAAYVGGDLSVNHHRKTLGVAKAIMSRVGNGPFVSEFGGEKSEKYCMENEGKAHTKEQESAVYNSRELLKSEDMFDLGVGLRMLSNEYGATTGRPRRLGMFDLVQLKQICALNGVDELYINKFDQLALFRDTVLPGVPLVTGYVLDGKEIDYVPTVSEVYRRVTPRVSYLPHLSEINSLRQYRDLPQPVKNIISFIEDFVEVKIHGIGVGPERDEFVDTSPEERMR